MSRKVKKSQNSLLRSQRRLSNFNGPLADLELLEQKHKNQKSKHKRLLRQQNASENFNLHANLFEMLQKNPKNIYNAIKAGKGIASRKIHQLNVSGKMYVGASVPDGFYDSLLHLKSFEENLVQDPSTFSRISAEYESILELCKDGDKVPEISFEKSTKILKGIKSSVNDFNSITANNFLNAGDIGINHFFLLLQALIKDMNSISLEEVNTVQ